ncbi:MAG: hypothetical protein ACLR4Z_03530 [Butyricicoccaceae bacterium]
MFDVTMQNHGGYELRRRSGVASTSASHLTGKQQDKYPAGRYQYLSLVRLQRTRRSAGA